MKKVEEKFGNKAHYNSEREPIHFTALPFGFFRISLSLSVFFLVWVHFFDFIIVFIALCFRVSNWLSSPKQKAHFNFIILFVPPARTNQPPTSPFSIAPSFSRFPLKFRIKRVLKQRRLLIVNFFFGTFSKPNTPCHISVASASVPALFSLRSLFAAHSLPSHSELINNFFLSSFCLPFSCRHT